MRVLATAGHVDHGKSTLIRVLTGTDPDRWAIEKARGMSIDLGFASTRLPSGQEIGFVDVPGHYKFIKKMVAGISNVNACLFVVDANEGWKPQSEEHLRILELFKIPAGVVVLTKVAKLDADLRELAVLELMDHLKGTFLADAEVILVDALSGFGIDELRAALDRLILSSAPPADLGRPRLWVDRAFAIRGAGTVVTGTLTGGKLKVNDDVMVQPGEHMVRIRTMESHGTRLDVAEPGRRLALNVTGIAHQKVFRGNALVRPGQWHLTSMFDASLLVLESVERPLRRKGAYAVNIGSGDFQARLRILGTETEIEPGDEGHVRLWLEGRVPLPLLPGDRYILRELGRDETIGGGEVLDVDPIVPPKRAAPSRSLDRVVEERGWVLSDDLERLTGEKAAPTLGPWVVAPSATSRLEQKINAALQVVGGTGIDLATLTEIERALVESGMAGTRIVKNRVFDELVVTDQLSDGATLILEALNTHKWAPPEFPLSDRGALRELERLGLAKDAGQIWFSSEALEGAAEILTRLVEADPQGFTVSEAREALGTTRKFVLPLLAYFDASGVTRRRGDQRIAGPVMERRTGTNEQP
jgi:selenocysteine-specific elongation factor